MVVVSIGFGLLAAGCTEQPAGTDPAPAQVPQTGQSSVYLSGDDGSVQAGVTWDASARFTDNGDGTISDSLTGLTWTEDAYLNGDRTDWLGALQFVEDQNVAEACGHDDWRLPNINELESLIDYGEAAPALPSGAPFQDVQYQYSTLEVQHAYWSSTPVLGSDGNPDYVLAKSMLTGRTVSTTQDGLLHVWMVRGGGGGAVGVPRTGWNSSVLPGDDGDVAFGVEWGEDRFVDHGDGTVSDTLTGLMWARDGSLAVVTRYQDNGDGTFTDLYSGETYTLPASPYPELTVGVNWDVALECIERFNQEAGTPYTDWRLPNARELRSLVDYSQKQAPLPPGHPFLNVAHSLYWTSTTLGAIPSEAGVISFDLASDVRTFEDKTSNLFYVWPVRGDGLVAATPQLPDAPGGLAAIPYDATRIDLSWTDGEGEESLRVERRVSGGSFAEVAGLAADTTAYSDTGLDPETIYEYQVVAVNADGESASAVVSAETPALPQVEPEAPADLAAVAVSYERIDLSWTDGEGEESLRVERRVPGGSFAEVASLAADTTAYSDAGLDALTSYEYQVVAVNGGGEASSDVASATTSATPPVAPADLSAVAQGCSQIDLSWTDGAGEESLRVERRVAGGTFAEVASLAADTTAYSDAGLAALTTYEYQVVAVSAGGEAYSDVVSAATSAAPPDAPADLAAVAQSSTQVDLSWTDGVGEETLQVHRREVGGAFGLVVTLPADSTSYSDCALAPLTTYEYQVLAVGAGGQAASAVVSATTLGDEPLVVAACPDLLWPPNHQMVPVTISVSGASGGHIVSVTSDEHEDGLGDGSTDPDWEITGDLTLNLRAERSGCGDGRVYTITVETDRGPGTATVVVPHHPSGDVEVEVAVDFSGSRGYTVTDAAGIHYHHSGYVTHEDRVYPEEYWGTFPLYFFGNMVGVAVTVESVGCQSSVDLSVRTEAWVLETDGSNGAALCDPLEQDVTVYAGEPQVVDASFRAEHRPGAHSGLDRLQVTVSEEEPVLTQEAIFCPPEVEADLVSEMVLDELGL